MKASARARSVLPGDDGWRRVVGYGVARNTAERTENGGIG